MPSSSPTRLALDNETQNKDSKELEIDKTVSNLEKDKIEKTIKSSKPEVLLQDC